MVRKTFDCGYYLSRRNILYAMLAVPGVILSWSRAVASAPAKETIETGDLLWPKKKDVYVPYQAGSQDLAEERGLWETQKKRFLTHIRKDPKYFSQRDIDAIDGTNFLTFHARYTEDTVPGQPRRYSGGAGRVSVGHVGIALVENGAVQVIEAMPALGVRKIAYAEWREQRPEQLIWHGRLNNLDAAKRAELALEALKYIGRPYDFWNFDLDDDRGFYCSKFVWLSANRSLGIAIDGNSNPRRTFWCSPKQLLTAEKIKRLYEPGDYK